MKVPAYSALSMRAPASIPATSSPGPDVQPAMCLLQARPRRGGGCPFWRACGGVQAMDMSAGSVAGLVNLPPPKGNADRESRTGGEGTSAHAGSHKRTGSAPTS